MLNNEDPKIWWTPQGEVNDSALKLVITNIHNFCNKDFFDDIVTSRASFNKSMAAVLQVAQRREIDYNSIKCAAESLQSNMNKFRPDEVADFILLIATQYDPVDTDVEYIISSYLGKTSLSSFANKKLAARYIVRNHQAMPSYYVANDIEPINFDSFSYCDKAFVIGAKIVIAGRSSDLCSGLLEAIKVSTNSQSCVLSDKDMSTMACLCVD